MFERVRRKEVRKVNDQSAPDIQYWIYAPIIIRKVFGGPDN